LDSPHRSLQKTRGWDLGPQGNEAFWIDWGPFLVQVEVVSIN